MVQPLSRRRFLAASAGMVAAASGLMKSTPAIAQDVKPPLFKISLAQWSLHRTYFDKKADPIDFAKVAKTEYGIEGVEYVNQFFADKAEDKAYLTELKKRADDNGVTSVLIMIDKEGNLGDPDEQKRLKAVDNHKKWVEAAKFLGCHSIRVNARSSGSYWEQMKLAADGLRKLSEFGATHQIGVIVENHGGLSSNGTWLSSTIHTANHPNCGTLPDFGNFRIEGKIQYDRYKGTEELMPFAKGVSAKSHEFDSAGNEVNLDYRKLLPIVLSYGYRGWIGIEYEGSKHSEPEGIMLTKKLLETVRTELTT
ncbi:sugar phosphate isomerase/epimerase family protein [Schlesneria paludicola]|uniref:sugar phosphate isomerase/epimerase family protein n=1 Tax=Schlesneria paludicola TaxID=360056 RepID=UPI00029B01B6|nr:sugar phosphate isomerase/epimerase family protein [Schlesneria paludicola]